MSVTFAVVGQRPEPSEPTTHLNLNNRNGRDLLLWLGLPAGEALAGELGAREVAARCRRRLWPVERNMDAPLLARFEASAGCAAVCWGGRPAGYLRQRTVELLALAERAGHGAICWY